MATDSSRYQTTKTFHSRSSTMKADILKADTMKVDTLMAGSPWIKMMKSSRATHRVSRMIKMRTQTM